MKHQAFTGYFARYHPDFQGIAENIPYNKYLFQSQKELGVPSPPTTDLPRPKSWDEFEDICADVLKRIWSDPYIVRNGRSGQRQYGVDCYGFPKHLGGARAKKYAGAQCKETAELTIKVIQKEVDKAKKFNPELTEYLFMTTASRDARLQESVRIQSWPFDRVHVMFWDDISLELSGHDDLLQKHFSGWMRRTTTEEQVLSLVLSSEPEDFKYDDSEGVFFHKSDVSLRIILDRDNDARGEFYEPWVNNFLVARGVRQPVYIYYGQTKVLEIPCVFVDNFDYIIPFPRSAKNLTITPFYYHVGCILNSLIPSRGYGGFDYALNLAGITIVEEK
jgi:hypothetical protein